MDAKLLSSRGEEEVLRRLKDKSRERRRALCNNLIRYALTPVVEFALRITAEKDDIVAVRKAARRALLTHWSRTRKQVSKPDTAQIKEHLAAHGITKFYHLTAKANLASIHATGGLFSRAALGRRNIKSICISERARDETCGTDEWVHLCLHPNQPMFYRHKSLHPTFVVLEMSIEVATNDSTVFSDKNSIAGYARLGPDLADLQKLDLQCFSDGMFTPETKAAWQAEVLVHPMISNSAILQIRSYAEALQKHQDSVPMGAKLEFLNQRAMR